MFGGTWEPLKGTVVSRRYVPQLGSGGEANTSPSYKYVVEVTLADGSTLRDELDDIIGMRELTLKVGQSVALLYNDRHRKLKWDKDDPDLKVARGIVDLDQFRDASGHVTREELLALAKETPNQTD